MRESSRKKWSEHLERFEKSGKGAKQWCLEERVSYQLLLSWKKRLREIENPPGFVELKSKAPIEIRCGGVEVFLSNLGDLKTLKNLLVSLC
jgi:hypothetical protein